MRFAATPRERAGIEDRLLDLNQLNTLRTRPLVENAMALLLPGDVKQPRASDHEDAAKEKK